MGENTLKSEKSTGAVSVRFQPFLLAYLIDKLKSSLLTHFN